MAKYELVRKTRNGNHCKNGYSENCLKQQVCLPHHNSYCTVSEASVIQIPKIKYYNFLKTC